VGSYTRLAQGEPDRRNELPIQYGDFAHWQRTWLKSDVASAQLDYWRHQLKGRTRNLMIPTDGARHTSLGKQGRRYDFPIPEKLFGDLKALARDRKCTLFMTLLACFKALVSRLASETDVCIGTVVSGRHRRETQNLIGNFINPLVMRTDFSANPTFEAMLDRVRTTTLGAFANQDIPFGRLVEKLKPERGADVQPFFQIVFALENLHMDKPAKDDQSESWARPRVEVTYDLNLWVRESKSGLAGYFNYRTDLFTEETIASLARRYLAVLQAVATEPSMTLDQLPAEDAGEQALQKSKLKKQRLARLRGVKPKAMSLSK
jgi:non-ribosomal peptide synthetase component F